MEYMIHAGVPGGITIDKLQSDIEMLLANDIVDYKMLFAWCDSIDEVSEALEKLYKLIETNLPHKTDGKCHKLSTVGRNSLLSMMMAIQDTQVQFTGGIKMVKNRVRKITQDKNQLELI